MRNITVETERLNKTAMNIETAKQDYQRLYLELYQKVNELSSAWSGKDNLAFANQIKSYQDDFRRISIILSQYSDFLRNSAKAYVGTQDELYQQATRLRTQ